MSSYFVFDPYTSSYDLFDVWIEWISDAAISDSFNS